MDQKVLVIPSVREACVKAFLDAWKCPGDWDVIILVEDNPTRTYDVEVDYHYSWQEIEETLGKDAWIISRRDSAIRCFGFLMASRWGAEYILTLDDDCYPHGSCPIFASHIEKMNSMQRWTTSVPGMRTRGLPYMNLGKLENVVANVGLWSGIPDLDAIQSLNNLDFATNGKYEPPPGNRLIPHGQYFPLCGMNFCFRSDMTPLCYFPLMGEGSPYGRFDDIWFGIIFKKIIDHLGYRVSVGEPFVAHQKASDVFANLVKEAPGIAANETFWQIIDDIKLNASTPEYCMIQVGRALAESSDAYLKRLGEALTIWAKLF